VIRNYKASFIDTLQRPRGLPRYREFLRCAGDWPAPARPNEDVDRLRAKGVNIFALADDLEERGISEGNCIGGIQMIRKSDLAGLMDDYEQVWHW
jgi:hypothetical protein